MDRVRVVGSSGSGKTTTARALAARLDVPVLELDAVHWLPGWQERDPDEFRRLVSDFASAAPRWVIDGNYNSRLGDAIDHLVDTVVWLDLPRWRVTSSLVARTLRRSVTRTELWGSGNTERLPNLFKRDPLENIVLWSWTNHSRYSSRYRQRQSESDHHWVHLRTRREIARFLKSV